MGKIKQQMLAEIVEPSARELWLSEERIEIPAKKHRMLYTIMLSAKRTFDYPEIKEFRTMLSEDIAEFAEWNARWNDLLEEVEEEYRELA